jgi:ankyrin repeat protein
MVGMPAVITDLEEQVDALARTERWIKGAEGLVPALLAEKYDFQTFAGQTILKQASENGQTPTVRELLQAGVPLKPIPAPKPTHEYEGIPFEHVSWLNAAASHPDVLELLIAASASKNDQVDKDLALAAAANAGSLKSVKALIAYGANPNVDLTKLTVTEYAGNITAQGPGAGSILIDAASSGKPEVVREILSYHPKLELRNQEGQTAIFAAGEYRSTDKDGDRVECIRLLLKAGANVNASDSNGNTPLHEIFLDDVNEELLKHGANVNARNEDGETPIFTNVSDQCVRLFIDHGADLNLRNNKGQTALEAAKSHGPQREALLLEAMQEANRP